jgi:ABC-type transporter Mla subunit MlaD
VSDDRTQLAEAVDRLEAITARLGDDGLEQDELRSLAEQALAASARVTELLPRIIREIERASEGDVERPAQHS